MEDMGNYGYTLFRTIPFWLLPSFAGNANYFARNGAPSI